jgi:hypothetical protein
VKALALGSGMGFAKHRATALKGVPGSWQPYAFTIARSKDRPGKNLSGCRTGTRRSRKHEPVGWTISRRRQSSAKYAAGSAAAADRCGAGLPGGRDGPPLPGAAAVTGTSRMTRILGARMWRSGCARSTGSARTRARASPCAERPDPDGSVLIGCKWKTAPNGGSERAQRTQARNRS